MLGNPSFFIIGSFFLCLVTILPLRVLALSAGLTDKPSVRKLHKGEIPLVGGIAIFLSGVLAGYFAEPPQLVILFGMLAAPLILVGLLDDMYDVNPAVRILVQIIVSLGMIYLADIRIDQIGDVFGQGPFELNSVVAPIFTVFCVIGVINAINMLDGCDGLAGSITLVTVIALTGLAIVNGDSASLAISSLLAGGLLAFLLYNTHVFGHNYRIFLGDAGSMFLGFALVWLFVSLSQIDTLNRLSPIAAGWLFGLPLVDVVSVTVRRVRKGLSPFKPGRDHLHHLLLDNGCSTKFTTLILVLVHGLFVIFGLMVNEYQQFETLAFWLFVMLVILHHYKTPALVKFQSEMRIRS